MARSLGLWQPDLDERPRIEQFAWRVEQLVQEAVASVPRPLIADAIDLIFFIAGRGFSRRVETIASVAGLDPDCSYRLADITQADEHQGD